MIVAPRSYNSWFESHTMRNGRIRFAHILRDAGVAERVRLVYPEVRDGEHVTDTMVHSKVMIVDERWLRVGSANLNNRSMGTDSECDLSIEAQNDDQQRAIVLLRARFLADHTGATEAEAATALASQGLLRAAETLSARGHRLLPIDDGEPDADELAAYIEGIADPERPVQSKELLANLVGKRAPAHTWPVVLKLVAIVALFAGLTIAWHYPPLSEIARPNSIGPMLQSLAAEPWAPILIIGIYLVGGLIAFPVLILIAATAAAFGPVMGLFYAATGALSSAVVTYAVGSLLGRETLQSVIGPRLRRVQRRIVKGGVLAIAAIRMVPLAPFTVVNLVAGASDIKLGAYVLGTLIGMAPGLLLMSALGHQFVRILSEPKLSDFALLLGVVLLWIAFAGGVQLLVTRFGKRA